MQIRRLRQEETSQLEATRTCYEVPSGGELREVKADAPRKDLMWDLWMCSREVTLQRPGSGTGGHSFITYLNFTIYYIMPGTVSDFAVITMNKIDKVLTLKELRHQGGEQSPCKAAAEIIHKVYIL